MSDTINRQDAMKCITEEYNRKRSGDGLKLAWIEKAVNSVPSAQLWIPCTERLPENNEDVLCCSYTGKFLIGTLYKSGPNISSVTGYAAESDSEIMLNCIAWMPLPKPYREVTE